jgi:hypothetical protein
LCKLFHQALFGGFRRHDPPLLTEKRFAAGIGCVGVTLRTSQQRRVATGSSPAAARFFIARINNGCVLFLRRSLDFWC